MFLLIAMLNKKPIAPTPPMGWSSWNTFQGNISEKVIKETADAFISKGLKEAGYQYVNIDDGYHDNYRDAHNKLVPDNSKFPNGFKPIANYIHNLGLKFGFYNCAGTKTCMGLPGSYGYEEIDAQTFAEWNIDMLKYDFCFNPIIKNAYCPDIGDLHVDDEVYDVSVAELTGKAKINVHKLAGNVGNNKSDITFTFNVLEQGQHNIQITYVDVDGRPFSVEINDKVHKFFIAGDNITKSMNHYDAKLFKFKAELKNGVNKLRIFGTQNKEEIAHYSYQRMAIQLEKQNRDILFSVCEWGKNYPWRWAQSVGHMWRTTPDINFFGIFVQIVIIYEKNVVLDEYAAANAYNDPDMLAVGVHINDKKLNVAHFSLWSIMMAPLLIGADVRSLKQQTLDILLNKDVIAVNQDILTIQGKRIVSEHLADTIAKPLANGSVAVLFFNKHLKNQDFALNLRTTLPNKLESIINNEYWGTAQSYSVKDLWTKELFQVTDVLEKKQIEHWGVSFYIITPNY